MGYNEVVAEKFQFAPFAATVRRVHGLVASGQSRYGDVAFAAPPYIAEIPAVPLSPHTAEVALSTTAKLEQHARENGTGGFMEGLLLRTEAINSSRIEGNRTKFQNLCRAVAGVDAKPGALETAKNLDCLLRLMEDPSQPLTRQAILRDHEIIMRDASFAGRFRVKSDEYVYLSNRGGIFEAHYVAPLPETVSNLIDDWLAFSVRTDIGIVERLALSHVQFESIHPFLDGNGRVGRVAIQRMLLLSGTKPLPVSPALLALKSDYFASFDSYRDGDIEPAIKIHALAIDASLAGMTDFYAERDELMAEWIGRLDASHGKRRNLYEAVMHLSEFPVFTQSEMQDRLEVSEITARRIIERLEANDIVQAGKRRWNRLKKRNEQTWEPPEIYRLAEKLEDSIQDYAKAMSGAAKYSEATGHSERTGGSAFYISTDGDITEARPGVNQTSQIPQQIDSAVGSN